jgi:hypothetical protein
MKKLSLMLLFFGASLFGQCPKVEFQFESASVTCHGVSFATIVDAGVLSPGAYQDYVFFAIVTPRPSTEVNAFRLSVGYVEDGRAFVHSIVLDRVDVPWMNSRAQTYFFVSNARKVKITSVRLDQLLVATVATEVKDLR